MSDAEHRDDPTFQAAAMEIAQSTSDHLRPRVLAACAEHPSLDGHQHCLSLAVARHLTVVDLVDIAQQEAPKTGMDPEAAPTMLCLQHARLLARDAHAALAGLRAAGTTVADLAAHREHVHARH